MNEKEMLEQLKDLISDRKSFLSSNKEANIIFQRDIEAIEKIIHDYMILRNAAYKSMKRNQESKEIWINENINRRYVDIIGTWVTDYDDMKCNAILYKGEKQVANIVCGFDETTLRYRNGNKDSEFTETFIKNAFKSLIYDDFDRYLKLPKLSQCSKLLQEIYDCVCQSEASMCHITESDWIEFYSEQFSNKDFERLKKEIKKYSLEDVVSLYEAEYKIIGYEDLDSRFNDDRNLERTKEYER